MVKDSINVDPKPLDTHSSDDYKGKRTAKGLYWVSLIPLELCKDKDYWQGHPLPIAKPLKYEALSVLKRFWFLFFVKDWNKTATLH